MTWITDNKGEGPWALVAQTNKHVYNEGTFLALSPQDVGGTPVWLIPPVAPSHIAITKTHHPGCGYWTKSYAPSLTIYSDTFYPVTQYVDNGYWLIEAALDIYFNNVLFGNYSSSMHYNAFVRFPTPTIPVGSTITLCKLLLTASANLSVDICNANIYFNDVDNAIAPTTTAEANALALTAAIAWNVLAHGTRLITPPYDTHTSPSLEVLLQSIISRPGYLLGNALQIVIKDNGSSVGAWRNFWAKLDGAPTYVVPPALYVEWTV